MCSKNDKLASTELKSSTSGADRSVALGLGVEIPSSYIALEELKTNQFVLQGL